MTNNTIPNVPRQLLDSLLTVIESNGYAADEVEVVDELRALLSAPSPAGVDGLNTDRNAAFKACPESGCDWGSFYLGWKARGEVEQAIIDGLRGDAAALKEQSETRWAAYVRESNIRREIEQQQRDQPACLLRDARKYLAPGAVRSRIDAALSGIKEPQ